MASNRYLEQYESAIVKWLDDYFPRLISLFGLYCQYFEPIYATGDQAFYSEIDIGGDITYSNTPTITEFSMVTGLEQYRPAMQYLWTVDIFLWKQKDTYLPPPNTRIIISKNTGNDVTASMRVTDKPPQPAFNSVFYYKFELVPFEQKVLENL